MSLSHRWVTVSLRKVGEWTSRTLLNALSGADDERGLSERARLLNNLGNRLSELGRREEALAAAEEALEKSWPFFERHPLAFAQNTAVMLRQLQELHESLQRPIPSVLQERIATFNRVMRS